MKIKTYLFDDVKEGMKKIKEEHGVDTIIVDIKNNGSTASRKGCEISIAVEGDRAIQGDDMEDMRRKMESVWEHNTRYMETRVASMETEIMRDRIRTYSLPLRVVFEKMMKNGFEAHTAIDLISEVHCALGPLSEDSPKASFFVKRAIASRVKVHNPLHSSAPLMFVGPSGAGKTETVKKLVELCARQALRVSVFSIGATGKGSVSDLKGFAQEKGMAFGELLGEHQLNMAMEAGDTRKIVDLSGPLDQQKKMTARFTAAEKIMVLPVSARDDKMKACCSLFKGQAISGLALTKLDEEETVGHMFESISKLGLPLAFLTTGPGEKDLVTPTPDMLYKILIEGNTWKRKESELSQ